MTICPFSEYKDAFGILGEGAHSYRFLTLTQLAGYHATGIKPEELADLLIKAAGFAGIAVQAGD